MTRDIEGMSGQRYRTFINELIASLGERARYLEIGSWKGSTLAAAIEGNKGHFTAIDNWTQFGGPKNEFLANIAAVKTEISPHVIEADFRAVDYATFEPFNVYLFDGPHEEDDQYDGLSLVGPALANPHVLIVDDWNWRKVRLGTFRAIHDGGWTIDYSKEIRTSHDDTHPGVARGESDWHNGYFIAQLSRR